MKVVSFVEPRARRAAMVGGLWQSRSAGAPPGVQELALELDASFADSALESADRADESQDLTYVDIDTFLENFERPPMQLGLETMRPS